MQKPSWCKKHFKICRAVSELQNCGSHFNGSNASHAIKCIFLLGSQQNQTTHPSQGRGRPLISEGLGKNVVIHEQPNPKKRDVSPNGTVTLVDRAPQQLMEDSLGYVSTIYTFGCYIVEKL